jgi:metal-sulfur cluster biosynthetic enzyme
MTLTLASLPRGAHDPRGHEAPRERAAGIQGTQIQIVWEPAWGPHRISPEGRAQLGIDPPEDEDE